jgi:hypothetical protein
MKLMRILCMVAFTFMIVIAAYSAPKDVSTPTPWGSWEKATALDGGAGLKLAKQIPAMDKWFSSTVKSAPLFYTVNVVKGATYELYWDDKSEGTGKYTGDIIVWAFKIDGKTKYDSKDKGYTEPLTIKAAETTINIVITSMSPGTFAFGIKQKK